MKLKMPIAQKALILEPFAEALRECGILWLVFSLLDRIVSGELPVPWALWNLSGSIVVWCYGVYIEARLKTT